MKQMKKMFALLLALVMVFALTACGGGGTNESTPPTSEVPAPSEPAAPESETPSEAPGGAETAKEITLWTYPIGNWGQEDTVKELMSAFEADTGIKVNVEYLTYTDGDTVVNTAITGGSTPDLIMEGPERLVANWGVNGYLVDLSDLLDDTDKAEIDAVNPGVLKACTSTDGKVYEYPLVMTAHCMAVNLTAFKEAGADQYLNLETHTWTTEDFFKAVEAMNAKFGDNIGAVFCNGQGGDQGTRALVNNLYGGTFTDADHTKYTWDDPKNIQAIQELYDTKGINFDASIVGADEIALFDQGALKMAFCWNIAQQLAPNGTETPEKTLNGDDIAFMAFPSPNGTDTLLQGGIWGFGIFDNGDEGKIAAAKEFIKYFCDSEHTADAVKAANYFAVRESAEGADLSQIWADNDIMAEYTKLMPYLGDYYQVTAGWAEARTAWWTMLQQVGQGTDVATAVAEGVAAANTAAGA